LSDDLGDAERRAARVECARVLAKVAEQNGDAGTASWAHEQILALVPGDVEAIAGMRRNAPALARLRADLVRAKKKLASSDEQTRKEALEQLAQVLRGMPGDTDILAEVLAELARATGQQRTALEAVRVAIRRGDHAEAMRFAQARVYDPSAHEDARIE